MAGREVGSARKVEWVGCPGDAWSQHFPLLGSPSETSLVSEGYALGISLTMHNDPIA